MDFFDENDIVGLAMIDENIDELSEYCSDDDILNIENELDNDPDCNDDDTIIDDDIRDVLDADLNDEAEINANLSDEDGELIDIVDGLVA